MPFHPVQCSCAMHLCVYDAIEYTIVITYITVDFRNVKSVTFLFAVFVSTSWLLHLSSVADGWLLVMSKCLAPFFTSTSQL